MHLFSVTSSSLSLHSSNYNVTLRKRYSLLVSHLFSLFFLFFFLLFETQVSSLALNLILLFVDLLFLNISCLWTVVSNKLSHWSNTVTNHNTNRLNRRRNILGELKIPEWHWHIEIFWNGAYLRKEQAMRKWSNWQNRNEMEKWKRIIKSERYTRELKGKERVVNIWEILIKIIWRHQKKKKELQFCCGRLLETK